jgi:Protein of unknown function (DUF3800)
MSAANPTSIAVPARYPTSLIYLDESGSRASADRFFVVGAVKVRRHGDFARAVREVRDRHSHHRREFKFSQITRGALGTYYDLSDQLDNTDIHVAACVVDRQVFDPFQGGVPSWQVHVDVASQLLLGCINRREQVGVLLDAITTPRGVSFEDKVKEQVNGRLRNLSVVTAACLNSKSSDGLQVADLVASAIAFERRRLGGQSGNANSPKAKVAVRLRAAVGGVTFADGRTNRVNIATYRGRPQRRPAPNLSVAASGP